MPSGAWGVAQVKRAEPETFFIFLTHAETVKGRFVRWSEFLSEAELRNELAIKGCAESDIDSLIARARANPA
jgi:hypothetical protein